MKHPSLQEKGCQGFYCRNSIQKKARGNGNIYPGKTGVKSG
jgi:hypothetical protein